MFSNAYKKEGVIISDKESKSNKVHSPKTSRRTFLKTGAAAAGAALLGAAVRATPSSATNQAQDNLEDV